MKELPVLCLAIIAIIFIHATSKSGQKNKANIFNAAAGVTDKQADFKQVSYTPAGFFTTDKIGNKFLTRASYSDQPKQKPQTLTTLSLSSPVMEKQSYHMGNGSIYDPVYLFFHQRVNFTYRPKMAVK